MARIVRFHELGAPADVLRIEDTNVPAPKANEVRIEIEAFALNRADNLFTYGHHYTLPTLPSRIGSEAAGRVEAVGSAVTAFRVGDHVCTIPFHTDKYGVQGELALYPEDYLAPWPDCLSAEQATSVWMQYLTAYFALIEIGEVSPDDHILIGAASSSAGLAAIQLCKDAGSTVIATTRTAKKRLAIQSAGADHVVVTDQETLESRIKELTDGKGVRLVYDPIGGPFMKTYVNALARRATIFLYGLLSGEPTEVEVVPMVRKAAILHPYSMFNHVCEPDELERGKTYVLQRLIDGRLKPIIDRVFAFDDTLEAYRHMDSMKQLGKIVVRV